MARSFNGSSQYFHAASAVATAPPIAMSCWFWADPAISQNGTLVSLCAPSPSFHRFELAVISATQTVAVATNSGGAAEVIETTTTWATGAWHHAFCVWQSSTSRKVWLDGGGEASSSVSKTPSGIAESHIGASRITGALNHFRGRLAEAAIWAGSGVENMGAAEAAVLAKSFSPRCLDRWLGRLVLHQDLVRPINRPGPGPAMTEAASPGMAAHPRMLYRTNALLGVHPPNLYLGPFHPDAAAIEAGSAVEGIAATTGAESGDTFPIGEVSS